MNDPVYILIRTANRPIFFKNMMNSIKRQTYKNIITIVHSDNVNDTYVEGDIIIRSERNESLGNGFYNLYCNSLLAAIPDGDGWYHFIDDDDMYYRDDVIERLVENSLRDHINVARVKRWNDTIFPKKFGTQNSFQTECFFLHTDHKNKATWWNYKGGDHNYTKQLTKILPINWIDNLIICKAQKGKGHGRRYDFDIYEKYKDDALQNNLIRISMCGQNREENKLVQVYYLHRVSGRSVQRGKAGENRWIPLKYAQRLQNIGKVQIVEDNKEEKVIENRQENPVCLHRG